MKRILLISNKVFHYREAVYNYFYDRFTEDGYEFHVASNEFQNVHEHRFITHKMNSLGMWREVIDGVKPTIVIMFLHLKDRVMPAIARYCNRNGIKVIYWNYGVSPRDENNKLKNALYHYIHSRCDALITYTPDMVKYFRESDRDRLFIAYNALNLEETDKTRYDKDEIRRRLGIEESSVVVFISRLLPYKRPDFFIDCFGDMEGVAAVLVGPGMTDELMSRVNLYGNVYYLGERYGEEVDEVYAMADAFSTPGHIGLAMNQALFWGLPTMLLKGFHAPEVYYMKDGDTGFLANDEREFRRKAQSLLSNSEELEREKRCCIHTYETEASIQRMYDGFFDAIKYCETRRVGR